MSQFKIEDKHEKFAILFNSFRIEERFKLDTGNQIRCVIVHDKEEARLAAIVDSFAEIARHSNNVQNHAVVAVGVTKSKEDALAAQLGILQIIPNGVLICPTCLNNAIVACEENLTILRDIKEAVKNYAA